MKQGRSACLADWRDNHGFGWDKYGNDNLFVYDLTIFCLTVVNVIAISFRLVREQTQITCTITLDD